MKKILLPFLFLILFLTACTANVKPQELEDQLNSYLDKDSVIEYINNSEEEGITPFIAYASNKYISLLFDDKIIIYDFNKKEIIQGLDLGSFLEDNSFDINKQLEITGNEDTICISPENLDLNFIYNIDKNTVAAIKKNSNNNFQFSDQINEKTTDAIYKKYPNNLKLVFFKSGPTIFVFSYDPLEINTCKVTKFNENLDTFDSYSIFK